MTFQGEVYLSVIPQDQFILFSPLPVMQESGDTFRDRAQVCLSVISHTVGPVDSVDAFRDQAEVCPSVIS